MTILVHKISSFYLQWCSGWRMRGEAVHGSTTPQQQAVQGLAEPLLVDIPTFYSYESVSWALELCKLLAFWGRAMHSVWAPLCLKKDLMIP